MTNEAEYILGTRSDELRRLEEQHAAWRSQALALFDRAGVRTGGTWMDLGCGPGFTTFELASIVGASGRVIARDESARFLDALDERARTAGVDWIETSRGEVETLALEPASLDGAYARWLFCWLDDPVATFAGLERFLRPGAAIALQDYLDWGSMRLVPDSTVFDRAVEACMQSWADGGGRIDVAREFPRFAEAASLELEHFAPVARIGAVGSPEWNWVGTFYATYLPKLVARGTYGADELEAFLAEWREREARANTFVYTPVVADAVFRKPS